MKKENKVTLKVAVALAMLSAISIILGKYLAIPGGEVLRFSFENLPIILAGIAFGPVGGVMVGAVADLLGCLMVGYTINPMVTLGAVSIGLLSGIVWKLLKGKNMKRIFKTAITVGIAHLIGSVLIKTVGLAVFYDMHILVLMLWRLLNYLIVGVLEGIVLYALLGNRMIAKEIEELKADPRAKRMEEDTNDVR